MNTLHRVSRRQVVGCGLLLAAGPSTGGAIANGHYYIPARSGPRAGGNLGPTPSLAQGTA